MAQKKAFVRYANNKAVPGSLIVRTKAPKVGTWKEVPYDLCCGGGNNKLSNLIVTTSFVGTFPIPSNNNVILTLLTGCGNYDINLVSSLPVGFLVTDIPSLVESLNANYPQLGLFTYTLSNEISLQFSSEGIVGLMTNSCIYSPEYITFTINRP